jgi:serine protease Do
VYLALCGIGASALAIGCANQAQARGDEIWREGKGRPVTSDKSYDPARSLAPIIKEVRPAVVSIVASGHLSDPEEHGFDRRIIPFLPDGMQMPPLPRGAGSGFIISKDGLVVTNHHVVAGRDRFEVKLFDGRGFEATVVGSDEETDVALLKLKDAKKLPTVVLGKSGVLEVGDRVFAIGSPMGLESSVTTGIVSAKGRGSLGLYRESYLDFLQTDAAIGPGNSGGPLFNLNGEVIGMNTAVSGLGRGLGFATPIDQAKWVIPQLKSDGKVTRGWLGISGRDVEPASSGTAPSGAMVGAVHDRTPADKAGLRAGDRVVKLDGEAIEDFGDLRGRVARTKPGQKVKVEVIRDGKAKKLDVVLEERPHPDELARMRTGFPSRSGGGGLYGDGPPRLGVNVEETKEGLVIRSVERGGVGDELGLRKGDVIEEVNGQKIRSAEDVRRAVAKDGSKVSVRVRRGDSTHSATIQRM